MDKKVTVKVAETAKKANGITEEAMAVYSSEKKAYNEELRRILYKLSAVADAIEREG